MANEVCKAFLKEYRKVVGAKSDEKIDKRYHSGFGSNPQFLAPNDKYYSGHCGHCAEVEYLTEIYSEEE